MQLFLLDHIDLKWKDIIIDNPELWQQAKKVLRLWSGDKIFVQRQSENQQSVRYEVSIKELRDMKIYGTVDTTQQSDANDKNVSMIVAMPNKREKAELIVQKLTEIGVNEIIFRPSERSIIKIWNENKAARLEKIAKEALEQSRGRNLPIVTFVTDVHERLQNNRLIVFDKNDSASSSLCEWNEAVNGLRRNARNDNNEAEFCMGLIGPEWGRWPKDYELFKKYNTEVKDLWTTVLRMETAAIVGAWVLKNWL